MRQQDLGRSVRNGLLEALPLQERRLDVSGVITCVMEGGKGPPVVLIHGGSQAGGLLWGRVIPRLAERHRIVVPDLPGLGKSDPVPRMDAPAIATWLAELLSLTCQEQPTLVAHSLPGNLVARFAAHQHDHLCQLVLVATPAIGRFRPSPALLLAAVRLNARPSQRSLARFSRWPYFDLQGTRAQSGEWHDVLDHYLLERAAVPHVKRTMRQLVKAGRKQVPDGELRAIEVPVTLLWGRHDRMAPLRLGEAASDRLGWPLHVIEDAGHLPHVERPESFVEALEAVLEAAPRRR